MKNQTHTPDIISALLSKDIELRDTTSAREAGSIRVIDAIPRTVNTLEFLTGGYCVAKLYGPNRDKISLLFTTAPDLLAECNVAVAWIENLLGDINAGRPLRPVFIAQGLTLNLGKLRTAIAKAEGTA